MVCSLLDCTLINTFCHPQNKARPVAVAPLHQPASHPYFLFAQFSTWVFGRMDSHSTLSFVTVYYNFCIAIIVCEVCMCADVSLPWCVWRLDWFSSSMGHRFGTQVAGLCCKYLCLLSHLTGLCLSVFTQCKPRPSSSLYQ